MTWRAEVIEAMPLGVEMTAPEIAQRIRPNMAEWERRTCISRVYKALVTEESYHSVVRAGTVKIRGKEVVLWKRVA